MTEDKFSTAAFRLQALQEATKKELFSKNEYKCWPAASPRLILS